MSNFAGDFVSAFISAIVSAQGPHSHILMTGGGLNDLFGSEILAKSDFLGL